MDELLTTRPATGPKAGPAGRTPSDCPTDAQPDNAADPLAEEPDEHPPEFDAARRRLGRSARDAAERLEARLGRVNELYDLGRKELIAAQRQIKRLRRAGLAPSAIDYWEDTAVPRAEILVEAALDAVVEETDRLGEAMDRFLVATSRSTLEPWINGADGRAAILRSGNDAVDRLVAAVPPPDGIDRLGEWWQRKLQHLALARAIPRLLVAPTRIEAVIGEAEVALLDSPPWSHGDRLLSAFELGHAEIRARVVELAEELTSRMDRRGQPTLVEPRPDGPALIKLADAERRAG